MRGSSQRRMFCIQLWKRESNRHRLHKEQKSRNSVPSLECFLWDKQREGFLWEIYSVPFPWITAKEEPQKLEFPNSPRSLQENLNWSRIFQIHKEHISLGFFQQGILEYLELGLMIQNSEARWGVRFQVLQNMRCWDI